jgi:hypothetical protein
MPSNEGSMIQGVSLARFKVQETKTRKRVMV